MNTQANTQRARVLVSPVLDGMTAMTVRVDKGLTGTAEGSTTKTPADRCILVGDVSGSMAGAPFNIMRTAMLRTAATLGTRCDLVAFGSTARRVTVEQLSTMSANEGTYFAPAFRLLTTLVADKENRGCRVVFFTDGQAADGRELTGAYDAFVAASRAADVIVHVIGFSADHDVRLLTSIQKAGAEPGIFQYIDNSNKGEIDTAIEVAVLEPTATKVTATVAFSDGMASKAASLCCGNAEPNVWQAVLFMSGHASLEAGKSVSVTVSDAIDLGAAAMVATIETSDAVSAFHQRLAFVGDALKRLATSLQQTNDTRAALALLQRLRDEVHAVHSEAQCLKGVEQRTGRRAVIVHALECKSAATQMLGILSGEIAAAAGATNATLAKLYDAAYHGPMRRGMRKKIDERAEKNAKRFEYLDKRRMELAGEAISNDDAEYLREFVCAVSAMTAAEALASGDAIGIGLWITRPEAAIADPSLVNVVAVARSLISIETFRDAVEFAVDADHDAHGGFGGRRDGDDDAGCILRGVAAEKINAVLALRITDQHWRMARVVAPPVYGWQVALDPFGYAPAQTQVLPFLALAAVMADIHSNGGAPTEFQSRIESLIVDTCAQTLADFGGDEYVAQMAASVHAFAAGVSGRTADKVANLRLMLAQLRVLQLRHPALVALNDAEWRALSTGLFEEAWRRERTTNSERAIREAWDRTALLAPFETQYQSVRHRQITGRGNTQDTPFRARFVRRIPRADVPSGAGADNADMSETVAGIGCISLTNRVSGGNDTPESLTLTTDVDSESLAAEVARFVAAYSVDIPSGMNSVFAVAKAAIPERFHSLLSPETYDAGTLALLSVQNVRHTRNADRRAAIEDGSYTDPFTDAFAGITRIMRASIVAERDGSVACFEAALVNTEASALAAKFSITRDLYEAAGLLLDTYMGRATFPAFVSAVCGRGALLPVEKMRMLLRGSYKGVTLFRDAVAIQNVGKTYGDLFWHPCKQTFNAFIRTHGVDEMTARDLFPRRKHRPENGEPLGRPVHAADAANTLGNTADTVAVS